MEANIAIGLGVVILFVLAAIGFFLWSKRGADRLRFEFGPEYERVVEQAGGRHRAQAQLQQREKRVRGFAIRPLTPSERERYVPAWRDIQEQFVDDPKLSVVGADQLLCDVMGGRGYPAGDFEQRSADLSVDYPVLVQDYRTAHGVAFRQEQDEANADPSTEPSTEDLRQAMLSYRALFDELVGESLSVSAAGNGEPETNIANSEEILEPGTAAPPEPVSQEAEVTPDHPAITTPSDVIEGQRRVDA